MLELWPWSGCWTVVQASRLVLWISMPCSAGTQVHHVNLQRPEALEKWRQQVNIHRRLWCSIGKVLSEFSPKKFLAIQEWPEHNSLWGESTYLRVAKKLGLDRAFLVKRCGLDGIQKRWWLATNRTDFLEVSQQLLPVCSCTSVEHVRPTATGFYSMEVVKYFWCPIQNYLRRGGNILPNLESSDQSLAEVNSVFNIPPEDHNAVRWCESGWTGFRRCGWNALAQLQVVERFA